MSSSVRTRADRLATFRSVSVQLMEGLARWVPTTPEMEAKVLFGRHIWDFAHHADLLGKRTYELRAPLHYTLPPVEDYQRLLDEVCSATDTADRVGWLYTGFLPGLAKRYGNYLETAYPILDEPSVRIIERICVDLERLRGESRELLDECPQFNPADSERVADLARREAMVESIVATPSGERQRRSA
jgi:hypothetical protein